MNTQPLFKGNHYREEPDTETISAFVREYEAYRRQKRAAYKRQTDFFVERKTETK